jgi:hypothetical protein
VRREDERDEIGETVAGEFVDRFLDHRMCVLQAEPNREPTGRKSVELALQLVTL